MSSIVEYTAARVKINWKSHPRMKESSELGKVEVGEINEDDHWYLRERERDFKLDS